MRYLLSLEKLKNISILSYHSLLSICEERQRSNSCFQCFYQTHKVFEVHFLRLSMLTSIQYMQRNRQNGNLAFERQRLFDTIFSLLYPWIMSWYAIGLLRCLWLLLDRDDKFHWLLRAMQMFLTVSEWAKYRNLYSYSNWLSRVVVILRPRLTPPKCKPRRFVVWLYCTERVVDCLLKRLGKRGYQIVIYIHFSTSLADIEQNLQKIWLIREPTD